jgi:GNAT superfamily N-acetyltransferase
MTAIRPLREGDLEAVAALYAELDKRDPRLPAPGYAEFFQRVMLDPPLADPEIPSLVYEDSKDGVVGFIGSHVRPFHYRDKPVRLACSGPMVVHPDHRPRGVGALLLRRFISGPQDATFNDRMLDPVHDMWTRLGGTTDYTTTIGWVRVLGPVSVSATRAFRRLTGRYRIPGRAIFAPADVLPRRRRRPPRPAGAVELLEGDALIELVGGLGREFELRPDYDERFLRTLFGSMEAVNVDGQLVRSLVRDESGGIAGAYVMYVAPHGPAEVLTVIAPTAKAGFVLDHLLFEAATRKAVEVRGRVEAQLFPHLQSRGCRLSRDYWTIVQSRDRELVNAVLSGRALLNRFDGEWWMRPRPEPTLAPLAVSPALAAAGKFFGEIPIPV